MSLHVSLPIWQHAQGGGIGPKRSIIVRAHQAGIEVREKPCLLQHGTRHIAKIRQCAVMSTLRQCIASGGIARFWPIAERKKRLPASSPFSGPRDLQHLFAAQIGFAHIGRRRRESAIVTYVTAQFCERNEDRSEEHTSELQTLMRNSYAVF